MLILLLLLFFFFVFRSCCSSSSVTSSSTMLILVFFFCCCCCSFVASSSTMLILLFFFFVFFYCFCRGRSSAQADIPVMTSSSAPSGVPIVGSSSFSFPPPSFSSVSYAYEVFLSFRGADIRKNFIDHLYVALEQRGIFTFKDDKRLRGGESISHQLMKAIEQSRSVIVVFSKDYASSIPCLDELEKIMECKEKFGLAVYPVFYDVVPAQVRRQTGTFGKGFACALKRKADKADAWRKALHDAADLSGYDVQNTADGQESQCIKQIVEWFWENYGNIFVSLDENLIGIKPRVRNLVSLLGIRDSDDDVRMIGIWGMGGSGKTTVAKAAFDEIAKEFDGASLIEGVREASQKFGLPHLQMDILSNILMEKNLKVSHDFEGKRMLSQRLGHKKVLIVLDDVDHVEQLRALAGAKSWFGKGSRIIITTRDKQLIVAHGIEKLYNADLLDEDEANQLFNKYAFKKNSRLEGYDELSLRVVRYAGGLPLALQVLGSCLCDRGSAEWISALERLANIPEDETFEKLKISYDGLQDVDKKIFLDIACFFKGWKRDEIVRILDSCEFSPIFGLSNLEQKTLITFADGKVQMHDLIQEMGRKIATQDAPDHEPGKHNRLWRTEDVSSVLEKNMGTEAIEAIVSPSYEQHCPAFDAKAFENMKKLRILYLRNWGRCRQNELEYLPNSLRLLSWYRYPHESLPNSFQAPILVGLVMQYSSIVQLWKGTKLLDKLKFLDLTCSRKLIRTPDFSGIPNLETLNLSYCSSLIEVHPSIGVLQRLVSLDLSDCKILVDLPQTICRLKYLKTLHLSGCAKLTKLPENLGHIESLEELEVGRSGVMQLPNTIGSLQKLKQVSMYRVLMLHDAMSILLQPLSLLSCLKQLDLGGCGLSEQAIPDDIGKLSFLEELDLSQNPFASLPSSISQLSRLKILNLTWCRFLKALPELPSSIAILKADWCTSLGCMKGLPEKCEWL